MNRITIPKIGWPFFARSETAKSAQVINLIQDAALGIAQAPGLMTGPAYVYSTSGTTIIISPISSLMMSSPNGTLSTSSDTTFTPSGLPASGLQYLYAYNSSGSIAFEYSTTGTDATRLYKSGDTTRRYITCFLVSGSAIVPFFKEGGTYLYQRTRAASGVLTALSAGNATDPAYTPVSLSNWIPSHTRVVKFTAIFKPRMDFLDTADIITGGDGGVVVITHNLALAGVNDGGGGTGTVSLDSVTQEYTILGNSSQAIAYKVSHANSNLTIYVNGFVEHQ